MVAINKIARAGILGGLLMGAVALKATNPITKTKAPEQNQTEIVSKEGAAALRVASLQGVQQTAVPTFHNPKLDKALRKYIESADDRKYIDNIINSAYKENGTFLGSAIVQHEIDFQHLYAFLSGNTDILIKNNINADLGKTIKSFGEAFYKTVKPEEDKASNWVMNNYGPYLVNALQFDHKPTATEVCKRLDDFATKKAHFNQNELARYYAYTDDFMRNNIKTKNDTQSMADLIAHKMFLIDEMLFEKELDGLGIFTSVGRFEGNGKTLHQYYKEWINSIEPKAD